MSNVNTPAENANAVAKKLLRQIYRWADTDTSDRWHFLLTNAPAFIVVTDPDAQIVFINRLLPGYKFEDVLDRNAFDFILPESVPVMQDAMRRARETRQPISYEIAAWDPAGGCAWFSSRIGALFQGEQFLGYMTVGTDITDRKLTLEKVKKSEQQLAEAQRIAKIGSWHWDLQTNMILCSEEMYRVSGRDPQTFVPTFENCQKMLHPDDLPGVLEQAQQALKSGRLQCDYRIVHTNGSIAHVRTIGEVLRAPDGTPVALFGTQQDITESKRVEESLKMQAHLLENMGEGVLLSDASRIILYVNPAFERIFGYEPGELTGKPVWILNDDPLGAEGIAQQIQHSLETTGKWVGEISNKRKNGETFATRARISSVDLTGKPCYMSVQEDITELKRIEANLRQSQKMEAIGKLAGGVAHDFNHLMMIILGNCEMMRTAIGTQHPLQTNLEEVAKAAERAAALTSQLLAFSRKQVQQPKPLNLNSIVEETTSLLRRLCAPAIELIVRLDDGIEMVRADPGQVEQVVMNLVLNARDAMPGGGKLFIETETITLREPLVNQHVNVRPGMYSTLSVTDTGCGMDESVLARIFEPFYTTKEPGKGTGLGLSMVYGIVKQSGGDVWVESSPGKGSRFQIFLPSLCAPEISGILRASAPVRNGNGSSRGTVLFAEDDERLSTLVTDYLTGRGFQVLAARSGQQALEISAAHKAAIDLLLSDVMMPQMTGPELVRRIREQRPEIKVIYMSGFTNDSVAEAEIATSEAAFVQKPITLDALKLKIDEVLASSPVGR